MLLVSAEATSHSDPLASLQWMSHGRPKASAIATATGDSKFIVIADQQYITVKSCAICTGSSQTVKWHRVHACSCDGQAYSLPSDELCNLCGIATEVWPLEASTPQGCAGLIAEVQKPGSVRSQFMLVRAGAEKMHQSEFKHREVHDTVSSGMRVRFEVGFITEADFKDWFQFTITTLTPHSTLTTQQTNRQQRQSPTYTNNNH